MPVRPCVSWPQLAWQGDGWRRPTREAFDFAAAACLVAAIASQLRGGKYVYDDDIEPAPASTAPEPALAATRR